MITINEPQVGNYLDISNVHIPEEAVETLDPQVNDWVVYEYNEGWFVWVPTDLHGVKRDLEHSGLHPKVQEILEYAARNGFNFVRFDADGARYPELKEYDW